MVAPVNFEVLPAGTRVEHLPFTVEDGALSVGFLYSKGGERGVICMTHPRGGLERHYMIPTMIEAGFAVFSFNHRMRTDDFDLVHEMLLLDIAGALTTMKTERGYDEVLLFGNSGGGGPLGYYQWQAEAAPPNRFTHTPAWDRLDLNTFNLPRAEGFILLAAGFGESVHVSRWIDPSVIDETDPLSCDPDLDMYSSRNGYRESPASSTYSEEFRLRYRAAASGKGGSHRRICQVADRRTATLSRTDEGTRLLQPSRRREVLRRPPGVRPQGRPGLQGHRRPGERGPVDLSVQADDRLVHDPGHPRHQLSKRRHPRVETDASRLAFRHIGPVVALHTASRTAIYPGAHPCYRLHG